MISCVRTQYSALWQTRICVLVTGTHFSSGTKVLRQCWQLSGRSPVSGGLAAPRCPRAKDVAPMAGRPRLAQRPGPETHRGGHLTPDLLRGVLPRRCPPTFSPGRPLSDPPELLPTTAGAAGFTPARRSQLRSGYRRAQGKRAIRVTGSLWPTALHLRLSSVPPVCSSKAPPGAPTLARSRQGGHPTASECRNTWPVSGPRERVRRLRGCPLPQRQHVSARGRHKVWTRPGRTQHLRLQRAASSLQFNPQALERQKAHPPLKLQHTEMKVRCYS